MHRPIAAAVPGSIEDDGLTQACLGIAIGKRLDLMFSLMVILSACTLWISSRILGIVAEPAALVTQISLVALCIGLPGLWLMERQADQPRLIAAQIYAAVLARLHQEPASLRLESGWEQPFSGVARLIGDLTLKLRERGQRQGANIHATQQAQTALDAGRGEAAIIAGRLQSESDALVRHIEFMDAASGALAGEIAAIRSAAAQSETNICVMTERAISLAGAVRATTRHAERAAVMAVEMSETAFAAQTSIAALDGKTAAITLAGTALISVLTRAQRLAGTNAPAAGGAPEGAAEGWAVMARSTLEGLAHLQTQVAELAQEAVTASSKINDMSVVIQAQHTLGQAVCHAVLQQGEEVAAVLDRLNETREGFVSLRAGVDAVSRTSRSRIEAATTLKNTIARLPGHADTIAGILRGLPDFAPPGY